MLRLLQALRSVVALLGVFCWLLVVGTVVFYGFVWPAALLRPSRRVAYASWFMKLMSSGMLRAMRAGGARVERSGTVSTDGPVLILMNHQSLVDILNLSLMGVPYTPAFVARSRYARWVPVVSPTLRLRGCPVIDPKRDARGAVTALRASAPLQQHGLLLFPEGHRSRDGSILPFKTAGVQAILSAHRMPICLVATDGLWRARRLVDFVWNVHQIRSRTEVLGCFEPPADDADVAAFVHGLREKLVARLAVMRADEPA